MSPDEKQATTYVVNELHAKSGRGGKVLALLLQLSPESATRPGCERISISRNQDDPDNVIGDTVGRADVTTRSTSPGAPRTASPRSSTRCSSGRC